MSLSKSQLKLITSLRQKKYRQKFNFFVVEGTKVVNEFLNSQFELEHLYCISDDNYKSVEEVTLISSVDLKKISSLKTPNNVLAIFKIPEFIINEVDGLELALDEINDPGNLGTIIRLCDWFGIEKLVCSENTVDCYNSKVVQSSMGSLTRINILYTNLHSYLEKSQKPLYASLMEGDNVYKSKLPKSAILVMGNEANGISAEILKLLNKSVSIPRFGDVQQTESLNVATATAILLSEFKRGN